MRGPDEQTSDMFSYLSPEQRVRQDHPLRAIRRMTDEVLATLSPRFTKMYSDIGRPSIPPEQLLRALLLQSLYTVRSERLLMEEIDYSVLFRWFVGLGMDDPIWSPTTFSKNRDRLLAERHRRRRSLMRWSRQARDGRPAVGRALHGRRHAAGGVGQSQELPPQGRRADAAARRSRAIRRSISTANRGATTRTSRRRIPMPELARKGQGKEAKLVLRRAMCCSTIGTAWWPNVCVTAGHRAPPNARRRCCCWPKPRHAATVGGRQRLRRPELRRRACARWASRRTSRRRSRAARSTAGPRGMPGYAISQQKRKLIEQVFGWMKTVGGLRKLRHRGGALVDWIVTFAAAAYNLIRLRTLLARPA